MEQPNPQICDLGAFRCPDATIHMRRALTEFAQNGTQCFTLISIEPSLPRSIDAILAQGELSIRLDKTETRLITPQDREQWVSRFDDEDHEDCSQLRIFHFTSQPKTNALP